MSEQDNLREDAAPGENGETTAREESVTESASQGAEDVTAATAATVPETPDAGAAPDAAETAPAVPSAAATGKGKSKDKGKNKDKDKSTGKGKRVKVRVARRYKKRRLKRPRPLRRLLRFLLILLLGVVVGYAAIAGAVYYAVSSLTIDDLQRFGIAENVDDVLTDGGEVDLTAMSLLDLVKDLNSIRADLGAYSLESLITRYGVVLPEDVLVKLPEDLLRVPLSEFTEGNPITAVAENLKCGYLLSFLPEGALNPRMVEAIKDRPLSLLMEGRYGELLSGVRLGYLTGVSFDGQGNVVYENPEAPTSQECLALLDLGHLVDAAANNGDIMAVLAADLGEQAVAPILTGILSGTLFEKMCADKTVADVLLANPESGRYSFSLSALTDNVYLGDALNYTLVDGVWYSVYSDDDNSENDTPVSAMQRTLAGIRLSDVIDGRLDLDQTFDGLYLGDLQAGYVRGEALTAPNPEGGEPVVTGYTWLKNGAAVSKIEGKLANVVVNDLLNGGLDVNAVLGDLYIGDLQGYTQTGDRWYRTVAGQTEPQYVGAVQNAIAGISLSEVLNGNLDIVATLGTLSLGDVQGYTLKADGWHRTVAGQSETEYVGAVQDALADIGLSEILEGGLDISAALADLLLGEAMGYQRGAVTEPADQNDATDYDKYAFTKTDGVAVTGAMLEIANLRLSDVLDGKADFEGAMKNLPLGEILEYTSVDGTWYEYYVSEGHADNRPATGVLGVLADFAVNEINAESINGIEMGDILGYTPVDANGDGTRDGWLDGTEPVQGMMVVLADLTVGKISDDDALMSALRGISLGDALGYTKDGKVWYTDAGKTHKLQGIMRVLADRPIAEITEATIEGIKLGDAIGYEYNEDEKKWYDGKEEATGAIANLAGLTLAELKNQTSVLERIGEMRLSTVLDYQWNGHEWICQKTKEPATGMLEYLLGMQIKDIELHTGDMPLGYAFGYHYVDGQWSTDAESVVAPTGVTAALVDIKLNAAAGELNTMPLGKLLGYTKEGNTWYEKYVSPTSPENKKLTGVTLAFANLSVQQLGHADAVSTAMQSVSLGDAMGYTKDGSTWYQGTVEEKKPVTGILGALASSKISEIEGEVAKLPIGTLLGFTRSGTAWIDAEEKPVTGVLAAIADCKAADIEGKLNTMQIGTLLGFTKSGTVWIDAEEKPVTGLLATVADTDVENLPSRMTNLTVADVFTPEERKGILAAVPDATKISDLSTAVMQCKIVDLVEKGVIGPIDTTKNNMIASIVGSNWQEMQLLEFMNTLFGKSEP